MLVRTLTCPFRRVLAHVPPSARTSLEIGAGHALFSTMLARRGLRAYAVEPDSRKMLHAQGVRWINGFDDCVRGSFDVVVILDVLYAIPIGEWDPLLARLYARVKPGGTMLIKEMDPEERLKNAWNRMQEAISMRLLRITMAETFNYEPVAAFVERLERAGFGRVRAVKVDAGYPHPHVLFVAEKPEN